MRIDKLWIVTRPKTMSESGDVCFETDIKGLALQLKGGLEPEDIHAVYTDHAEVEWEAGRILAAFEKYDAALKEGLK
ncbi:MAG: hypothetical protein HY922_17730 [Elusimicrobia bacterium]|nr:hypothetical protein [Elusimicrobiota bacterium]